MVQRWIYMALPRSRWLKHRDRHGRLSDTLSHRRPNTRSFRRPLRCSHNEVAVWSRQPKRNGDRAGSPNPPGPPGGDRRRFLKNTPGQARTRTQTPTPLAARSSVAGARGGLPSGGAGCGLAFRSAAGLIPSAWATSCRVRSVFLCAAGSSMPLR